MKKIRYFSNSFSDIFPKNSRSKFQNEIKKELIPLEGEVIVFASIKKIIIENLYDIKSDKIELLALKSNLNNENVLNNNFTNILCVFKINYNKSVEEISFENPTFFSTTREKLAHANFEIINFETKKQIDFLNGNPTIIELDLKKKMNTEESYNVFLTSDDIHSKNCFKENRGSNFKIELPYRFELDSDWSACLKFIHLSNDIYNIYSDECYIKIQHFNSNIVSSGFNINTFEEKIINNKFKISDFICANKSCLNGGLKHDEDDFIIAISDEKILNIPSSRINTSRDLIEKINGIISDLKFTYTYKKKNKENNLTIELIEEMKLLEYVNFKNEVNYHCKISLSPSLCGILGIECELEKDYSFILNSKMNKNKLFISKINLNYLLPKTLTILCNIVAPSIYGRKNMRILKIINIEQINKNLRNLEFLFTKEDFVKLDINSFGNIEIQILDITGGELKAEFLKPTNLCINFKKM